MLCLIKQIFTVLLCSGESLVSKCISLNIEPFMIRSFLIDLNRVKLKYFPFMDR